MTENSKLLLAVDTSSSVVSTALVAVDDQEVHVVAWRDVTAANRHGELLTALVDEVLREAQVTATGLDAVAAGLGPGPFTGLRVGVVTAASLADALNIPSYGACSLDAIAHEHRNSGDFVVCTDARRKQVYWARYDGAGRRVDGPDIAPAAVIASRFANDVDAVIGAGTVLFADEFAAFGHVSDAAVSARALAQLLAPRVRANAPSDVMEPMYLRRPDAAPPGRPKSVLPA